MSVSVTINKKRETGNGVKVDFDAGIKIFNKTELEVSKIDTSVSPEVATLLVLDSDYTVVFDTAAETLTVTYTVAPTSDEDSFIKRVLVQDQQSKLPIEGGMPETTVENMVDKNALLIQDLQEQMDRAVLLGEISEVTGITIPDPEANKGLKWDPTGAFLINTTFDPDTQATAAAASAAEAVVSASAASSSASAASTSESNAAASAASINLPALSGGDAGKILEVNIAEDGYDLVAKPTVASPVVLTAADTSNEVPLTINQNDVTNNPTAFDTINTGTGHNVSISQPGVLASGKNALKIESSVAQVNGVLVFIDSNSASTTQETFRVDSSATNAATAVIRHLGSGTGTVLGIESSGTGNGVSIIADGVLAVNQRALKVFSNTAQTTSPLVDFTLDNASSTQPLIILQQDGSGVQIDGTGNENLSNAGLWVDRSSIYAEKENITDLDVTDFADKLKNMKMFRYQKRCEIYGNKIEEIVDGEKVKIFSSVKKRQNAPYHIGHILDDPSTPEELIYRDIDTGKMGGLSAQYGVHFLLAVCKNLINRLEVLESV